MREAVGERSLARLDADAIVAQLRALPTIQDATVDRAFPHRLDVRITPEVPVGRLPAGSRDAIVARSGRVAGARAARPQREPAVAAAPADVPRAGPPRAAPLVLDQIEVAAAAQRAPGRPHREPALDRPTAWSPARAASWELRLGDADDAARKLVTGRAAAATR